MNNLVQVREDGRDFGPGQAIRMAFAIEIEKAPNPIATSLRRGRRLLTLGVVPQPLFSKTNHQHKREDPQ